MFALFLLWATADTVRAWLGLPWPAGWQGLGAGVWFAAALTLAVGLARRLPMQNVVAVVCLAAVMGSAVEALNAATNLPFGHRAMTDQAGIQTVGVGGYQPFLWVALAISGRGVARLILRPWRKLGYYGFWVMGAATLLTLVLVLMYEPFGTGAGWWWRENRAGAWNWYGAPVASVFGWVLTTLLIYGFTTPWFLNKQPVKQPTDWHPLLVWEGLLVWMVLGNAVQGAWTAVVVGAAVGTTAAVMAVRGGTW